MTTRLPVEELLQVIRISQAERLSEAHGRRDLQPGRGPVQRTPSVPLVGGVRRPAQESAGRWQPVTRVQP